MMTHNFVSELFGNEGEAQYGTACLLYSYKLVNMPSCSLEFSTGSSRNLYLILFVSNFLCNNTRGTNSYSNSVSVVDSTEKTCVRQSDALKRYEHARGKWFATDTPLFIARQTLSWKTARSVWLPYLLVL